MATDWLTSRPMTDRVLPSFGHYSLDAMSAMINHTPIDTVRKDCVFLSQNGTKRETVCQHLSVQDQELTRRVNLKRRRKTIELNNAIENFTINNLRKYAEISFAYYWRSSFNVLISYSRNSFLYNNRHSIIIILRFNNHVKSWRCLSLILYVYVKIKLSTFSLTSLCGCIPVSFPGKM